MLGPTGIDMYLASMPAMAHELHTSYANVQLSLTVFLLALGGEQLLFLTVAGLLVSWLTLATAHGHPARATSLGAH